MKIKISVLLFLTASFISIQPAFPSDIPEIVPSAEIIDLSNRQLPLDKDTFIASALLLSGADRQEIDSGFRKIIELQTLAEKEIGSEQSIYEKGRKLLEFLHSNLFQRYSEMQTRIDTLLSDGVYNCVSSAVIYIYFARHFNLPVTGSSTLDHAFCSIIINDKIIDIETTSEYGFDPGKKLDFHDSFGNITGFVYVPPSDYNNRFDANDLELLSYILQNKIVLLQRSRKYELSVPLAVDRYFLVNSEQTRQDMFLEFNNYISNMNNRNNYDNALSFISQVIKEYRNPSYFQKSIDILLLNYTSDSINSGSIDRVYDILKQYGYLASDATFQEIKKSAFKKEIFDLINSGQYGQAISLTQNLHSEKLLDNEEYSFLLSLIYTNSSIDIADNKGSLDAYYYVMEGIKIAGNTMELKTALSAHKNNAILDFHNNFVNEYNSGQTIKAENTLLIGLDIFPDSSILKKDLNYLNQ